MEDDDIFADLGGFTNNNARRVVDEDATTDLGAGVNVNTCHDACCRLQHASGQFNASNPQGVRNAVCPQCMNARIGECNFNA